MGHGEAFRAGEAGEGCAEATLRRRRARVRPDAPHRASCGGLWGGDIVVTCALGQVGDPDEFDGFRAGRSGFDADAGREGFLVETEPCGRGGPGTCGPVAEDVADDGGEAVLAVAELDAAFGPVIVIQINKQPSLVKLIHCFYGNIDADCSV